MWPLIFDFDWALSVSAGCSRGNGSTLRILMRKVFWRASRNEKGSAQGDRWMINRQRPTHLLGLWFASVFTAFHDGQKCSESDGQADGQACCGSRGSPACECLAVFWGASGGVIRQPWIDSLWFSSFSRWHQDELPVLLVPSGFSPPRLARFSCKMLYATHTYFYYNLQQNTRL